MYAMSVGSYLWDLLVLSYLSIIYKFILWNDFAWIKSISSFLTNESPLCVSSLCSFPLPVSSRLAFSLKLKSTQLKVRHWHLTLQAPLSAFLSAAVDAVAGCLIMLSALPFVEGHCLFGLRLKVTSRGPNYIFTLRKVNSAQPNRSVFIDCLLILLFLFNSSSSFVSSEIHLSLMKTFGSFAGMQASVLWRRKLSRRLGSIGYQISEACWTSEALNSKVMPPSAGCQQRHVGETIHYGSCPSDSRLSGSTSLCLSLETSLSVSASNVSQIFDHRFSDSISPVLISELCVSLNTTEQVFPLWKFSRWITDSTGWINRGKHDDRLSPTATFLQSIFFYFLQCIYFF